MGKESPEHAGKGSKWFGGKGKGGKHEKPTNDKHVGKHVKDKGKAGKK